MQCEEVTASCDCDKQVCWVGATNAAIVSVLCACLPVLPCWCTRRCAAQAAPLWTALRQQWQQPMAVVALRGCLWAWCWMPPASMQRREGRWVRVRMSSDIQCQGCETAGCLKTAGCSCVGKRFGFHQHNPASARDCFRQTFCLVLVLLWRSCVVCSAVGW